MSANTSPERIEEIRENASSAVAKANPNAWVNERDLLAALDLKDAEIAALAVDRAILNWLEEHKEFMVTFSQSKSDPSWGILHQTIPECGCWYGSGSLREALLSQMKKVDAGYPDIHPSGRNKLDAIATTAS